MLRFLTLILKVTNNNHKGFKVNHDINLRNSNINLKGKLISILRHTNINLKGY